jgi:hypothetical protein
MSLDYYVCAKCGESCVSTRPDAEAVAEYEKTYGVPIDATSVDVICDDCFKLYVKWLRQRFGDHVSGDP